MEVLLRIWAGHSIEGITDKYTVGSTQEGRGISGSDGRADHTRICFNRASCTHCTQNACCSNLDK
jgi:hypothetical protein